MIAARQFRMSARKAQRDSGDQSDGVTATAGDIENIEAFAMKLTEATELLRKEIAAIKGGELHVVGELYEDKSAMLKWLELKMPLVEPFMNQQAALARKLPEKLGALREAVTEDSDLLARMASAAGTIVREIEKATQRHSLNGLYGKSGQKLSDQETGQMKIDREF